MKKNSFLRRLIVSFLLIAVFPLAIVVSIFSVSTVNTTREAAQQRLGSAADQVSLQLDSLLNHMSYISVNMIGNDDFMFFVRRLEGSKQTLVTQESYAQVRAEICSYAIISSMYDVTFFNDQGNVITSYDYNTGYNYTTRLDRQVLEDFSWYDQLQDNYGLPVVLPVQQITLPENGLRCLSMVRAIRDPGKNVGYLRIDLEEKALRQLLETDKTVDADLLIVNNDGTVIYRSANFPTADDDDRIDAGTLEALRGKYFLTERKTSGDIRIYLAIAKVDAFDKTYNTLFMLLILTAVLLLLTTVVIVAFSRELASPLTALQKEMQETTLSNLHHGSEKKIFNRFDEISFVYTQFQDMRKRLDGMVQREMENQKLYMEEQMNYLQAQINPHFMCNTLNVIGIMGLEHGAQDVQDACLQLSSLLRYSISDSSENKTTVEAEMQNIVEYLYLMQLRYEHKLTYKLDYDEAMKELLLPRLVLEPFVENIFAHAYGPRHKTVTVEVKGWLEGDRWFIRFSDNGQGLPREKLQSMTDHIRDGCEQILAGKRIDRKYGIGIENTMMRLCLYFGDSFQYVLESEEDKGFTVVLSARAKRDTNDETYESDHSGG